MSVHVSRLLRTDQVSTTMVLLRYSLPHIALTSCIVAVIYSTQFSVPLTTSFSRVLPGALAFYLFYWSYVYPFYISPLRHLPTVPGWPLFGHIWTAITRETDAPRRAWHKRHGPVVRFFQPFGTECVSITDDGALHHVTLSKSSDYEKADELAHWLHLRLRAERANQTSD